MVTGDVHPLRPRPRSSPPGSQQPVGRTVRVSGSAGNLVGTPEQVGEKIQTYVDLGCTGFIPWCSDYPDTESMELLATEVMPDFR